MSTVFISYRRADSQGEARLLHRDLVERFGKSAIFMDVTGIAKGRDFRVALSEQLSACRVALVVIGSEWLAVDKDGTRRVDDERDYVRHEVATILGRSEIPVIPVLVSGAAMPRAADLPEDIRDLIFRDGVELTHARWESDVAALIAAIEPYIEPAMPAPSPPEPIVPVAAPATTPAPDEKTPGRGARRYAAAGLAIVAAAGALFYFTKETAKPTTPPAASATPLPSAGSTPPDAAVAKDEPVPAKASKADAVDVAASGTVLITSSADGSLLAMAESADTVLWRKAGHYRCVAPFDRGQVLVLDDNGVSVIGKDGKVARSLTYVDVRWVTRASRFGDDGVLLSSGDKKWVKAVDWTGSERWSSDGFHFPGAAIRIKGGALVADGTATIKVLDQTGKVVRELPVSRWAISLAHTPDGGVAVGVSGGVDRLTPAGATEWKRDGLGRISSVQALPNGELLVADPDNARMLKLNERGEIIWQHAIVKGGDCAVELE